MAFLLAQADFLTRDQLMAGVVEETVEEDTLLDQIMFEDIAGHKQVVWNRESSLGAVATFREVNEEIAESAPTYSNQTQALSILSTRVEIDNFEAQTKGAVQAVIPTVMATKFKQMWRQFHDTFYYGTAKGASSSAFAGLHNLVSTATPDMTTAQGSGAVGAALSLANLDATISLVIPGKPDALIMNRNILNRLSAPYISTVTYNIDKNTIGDKIPDYGGIPIVVTDFVTQTETIATAAFSAKTGGATTTIFAVKWGRDARTLPGTGNVFNNNGVLGVQGGGLTALPPHAMEKKSGFSFIIEWYVTVILGSNLSLARIDGITNAAVVV